jgi:hypothetical protein
VPEDDEAKHSDMLLLYLYSKYFCTSKASKLSTSAKMLGTSSGTLPKQCVQNASSSSYVSLYMYRYQYEDIYIYMYICTCIYIYTYIYVYIYIYII